MPGAARELTVFRPDPWANRPQTRRRTPGATPTPQRVPTLWRDGIAWRTVGTDVAFSIEVANRSDRPTEPSHLVVEAAHLGAFLPGMRVARIAVSALGPGERRSLAFKVARKDLPSPRDLARALIKVRAPRVGDRALDLITSAEWAGNINVWFDVAPEQAVEVHRALDVKVTAGRSAALAIFLPPHHAPYNLALATTGRGWTTEVIRGNHQLSFLFVKAPGVGERALVNLLVTRRADSRMVPVDFSFESVDGPSEGLGCIRV